jgi:predicted nuclease with TOPRIM domain
METLLLQILEGQAQINMRLDSFEKHFSAFEDRFTALEKRFGILEKRFDALEDRFDILENTVSNIAGQLDENTQLIKAFMHRTDELDAKFEGLLHHTATRDSISSLDSKFDLLNHRLFQTENKINLLSIVK